MKKRVMSPKAAFVSSVLSLLLCLSMFVGTTFAWYTESISNNANNIMSGNLDVELEYYNVNQNKWLSVDDSTELLKDNALWEPGYTEVVYLRVVNKGSLALKYQLGVSVAEETLGVNKDGEPIQLSKYIMFGVEETDHSDGNTYEFKKYNETDEARLEAVESVKDSAKTIGTGYSKASVLKSNGNMDYLTMVVYMPTTVGNEANAASLKERPSIKLAVNLVATQTTNESDAFGIGYDADAMAELAPVATVVKQSAAKLAIINATEDFQKVKIYPSFSLDQTDGVNGKGVVGLEFAYSFTAKTENLAQNPYKDWLCDYYVSFDKPLTAGAAGLAGQYDKWSNSWIYFDAPKDIPANEAIPLLGSMTGGVSNWTYEGIVTGVETFNCGAYVNDPSALGTTMTVELRLINPTDTEDYIVAGEYSHTFNGDPAVPEAKVTENATPSNLTGKITKGMDKNAVITTNFQLNCEFEFATTQTKEEAQINAHRYWHADFVVSANNDVAADSIALAGYYEAYCEAANNGNWVALINEGEAITAGTEIRLLELMLDGGSISYQELCEYVPTFLCGAADLTGANAGTTLTVELRLYEVTKNAASTSAETGNYITVGTYTHTF